MHRKRETDREQKKNNVKSEGELKYDYAKKKLYRSCDVPLRIIIC